MYTLQGTSPVDLPRGSWHCCWTSPTRGPHRLQHSWKLHRNSRRRQPEQRRTLPQPWQQHRLLWRSLRERQQQQQLQQPKQQHASLWLPRRRALPAVAAAVEDAKPEPAGEKSEEDDEQDQEMDGDKLAKLKAAAKAAPAKEARGALAECP
jgi:hypothetical protein